MTDNRTDLQKQFQAMLGDNVADDGPKPKFNTHDKIVKVGGYAGPGEIVASFLGDDGRWRYVVAHAIQGGIGRFYHIYVANNLERSYD